MPIYWPILKWRHREAVALRRLSCDDAASVCPLFEVPLGGWDYDAGHPITPDAGRFREFGSLLAETWGQRGCAIDTAHLAMDGEALLPVVIDSIFHQARINGCRAKPVVSLGDSHNHVRAIVRVLQVDGDGIVIRLRKSELDQDWPARLTNLLKLLSVQSQQCDLLIDFESHSHGSSDWRNPGIGEVLARLPDARSWRSLIVAATAIPAALPFDQYWPHGAVARSDLTNYWRSAERLSVSDFALDFSDYAVQHPNAEMIDPRLVGRSLTLVYATTTDWKIFPAPGPDAFSIRHIAREWKNVIDEICRQSATDGRCWADEQLEGLCDSPIELDSLRSWPQIATNRHLSVTARQMRSANNSRSFQLPSHSPSATLSFSDVPRCQVTR